MCPRTSRRSPSRVRANEIRTPIADRSIFRRSTRPTGSRRTVMYLGHVLILERLEHDAAHLQREQRNQRRQRPRSPAGDVMWRLIEQGHIELLLPEIAIVVRHADAQPAARLQEAYARIEKTSGDPARAREPGTHTPHRRFRVPALRDRPRPLLPPAAVATARPRSRPSSSRCPWHPRDAFPERDRENSRIRTRLRGRLHSSGCRGALRGVPT